MFSPKTWCTKKPKPFGYQVLHHGYILTFCPGPYPYLNVILKLWLTLLLVLCLQYKINLFLLKYRTVTLTDCIYVAKKYIRQISKLDVLFVKLT